MALDCSVSQVLTLASPSRREMSKEELVSAWLMASWIRECVSAAHAVRDECMSWIKSFVKVAYAAATF